MRNHDTLTKALIVLSSFFVLSCQHVELPETQQHKIVASVGAYNTKANFHMTETPNVLCEWNGRETLRVYYKRSNGKYHSTFANAPVARVEEEGKSADFTFSPEQAWGFNGNVSSYPVAIFTVNCFPTIDPEDGSIYLDARLVRQPLKDFELPVYYVGEVVNGTVEATFSHYYAYEFLHVKNTSDKTIEFSLNGYETPWIWYKKLASVGLEDGVVYNKSWSGLTPTEVSYPVSIAPGSSDIIVSAYIPNDFIIKDASIVATIDGNVVKSSNKKSSAAPLVPGRAYHMYATWDGNELKFIDNGSAAGTISVEEEKIEFGDVFVDETGTEYLTIHNNGTAEQKVKVSIEDYTYSSPFDLPGAGPGDGYVYKVVPAGGSRSVALLFRASSPDDYDGNALVSLDGSDNVECIVPLHGKGIAKPDEDSFHLSKNSIEIYVHTMMNVRIRNGSGDYDVVNENPDIVDYEIRIYSTLNSPATRSPGDTGGKITDDFWEIKGKKVGEATLRLADKKTKEELTLRVKVEPSPELTLARHDVELAVAERSSVEVLTGSDWYDITIDNPSVVSANFATISSSGRSSIYEDDRPGSGIFVMLEGLSVGQTTVRVKDMSSYEEATIQVTVAGGLATPEIVDLGLSVKWASFNLGATKPEEFGYYYAWGETEPKDEYWWDTYKFNHSYSYSYPYHTLAEADDAARMNLGEGWRIPTKAEWLELITHCELTRLEDYSWQFTAPNGSSIIIPAAGEMSGRENDASLSSLYWSSTVFKDGRPYYYGSNYHGYHSPRIVDYFYQSAYGHPIRAVYGGDPKVTSIDVFCEEYTVYDYLGRAPSLEYPLIIVGSYLTKSFTVYNEGDVDLTVSVTDPTTYGWWDPDSGQALTYYCIPEQDKSFTLSPYQEKVVTVQYVPLNEYDNADGHVYLHSNAQEESVNLFVHSEGGVLMTKGAVAEPVDLGLSVKWASWNLGASKESDGGNYYAWGETSPKLYYNWESYKYYNTVTDSFTKYNSNDGKTVLEPMDDAAYISWGQKWRIPTEEEFKELKTKCTREWTTVDDVPGCRYTGPNGNSIFLPAGGECYEDNIIFEYHEVGLYWLSNIYGSSNSEISGGAYDYVYLPDVGLFGHDLRYKRSRFIGKNIRPVYAD